MFAKHLRMRYPICALLFLASIAALFAGNEPERLELPGLLGKWFPADPNLDKDTSRPHSLQWVEFLPDKQMNWSVKVGPTSEPKIRRGTYALLHAGNFVFHSTKRVVLRIDPLPYDPAIGGVREDGTPIFLMDVRVGKGIDNRFHIDMELLKFKGSTEFVFTRNNSEQNRGANALPRAAHD